MPHSYIQSVLIDRHIGLEKALKVIKANNWKPIKHVDTTANYYRFRLAPPRRDHEYRIKR